MQQFPCKGCTERWTDEHTNCHATCKKYLEAAMANEEQRNKIYNEKRKEEAIKSVRSGYGEYTYYKRK